MPTSFEEQLRKNRIMVLRFLAPALWVIGPGVFWFTANHGYFSLPILYLSILVMWFTSGVLIFTEYSQVLSKKHFFLLLGIGFIIQYLGFLFFFLGTSSLEINNILDVVSFVPVLGIPQLVVTGILFGLAALCKKSPRFFSIVRALALSAFFTALSVFFIYTI